MLAISENEGIDNNVTVYETRGRHHSVMLGFVVFAI